MNHLHLAFSMLLIVLYASVWQTPLRVWRDVCSVLEAMLSPTSRNIYLPVCSSSLIECHTKIPATPGIDKDRSITAYAYRDGQRLSTLPFNSLMVHADPAEDILGDR